MSETFQYARRRKHIPSIEPFKNRYKLVGDIYTPEYGIYLGAYLLRIDPHGRREVWRLVAESIRGDSWLRMSAIDTCYFETSDMYKFEIYTPTEREKEQIENSRKNRIESIYVIVGKDNYIWI